MSPLSRCVGKSPFGRAVAVRRDARFAKARVSSATRKAAILQTHEAMRSHLEYALGTGRPFAQLVRATEGRVIVKGGAEGYLAAFVPR